MTPALKCIIEKMRETHLHEVEQFERAMKYPECSKYVDSLTNENINISDVLSLINLFDNIITTQ